MKAITPDNIVEAVKENQYGLSIIEVRMITHFLIRTYFSHFTYSMIGEYTDNHRTRVQYDFEQIKDLNLLLNVAQAIYSRLWLKMNKL